MTWKCKNCKTILEKEGTTGMKKRQYKPKATFLKKRRTFPFGTKSRSRTVIEHCKNCNGKEFVDDKQRY